MSLLRRWTWELISSVLSLGYTITLSTIFNSDVVFLSSDAFVTEGVKGMPPTALMSNQHLL